jgi:S-adenosylmethionine decarboxylase
LKPFGRHLLAEYRGCDSTLLNDIDLISKALRQAAVEAGSTIVASVFHPFTPQGVTGVVVLEESHLSIHTWPEHGYVAVDFYTCGDCKPDLAHEFLSKELGATYAEVMFVDRGMEGAGNSMSVRNHTRSHADAAHRR